MTKCFLIFFVMIGSALADVKSTTGEINFDTEADGQTEMTLNAVGLGIGVSPASNLHLQGNGIVSGELYVGADSGSSNLNINGTIGFGYQTILSDTTLGSDTIVFVDTSNDNIILTLPSASSCDGRVYHIKRIRDNDNYVRLVSSDNIDESSDPYDIQNHQTIKMISNGVTWYNLTPENVATKIVASDNLVGWWKLDESGGNIAYDSSLNGNHGVFEGTISSTAGKISSGFDFDGASEQIEIPNEPFYDDLTVAISISCWFKVDSFDSSWQALVTKGDSSWRLHRNSSSNIMNFTVNGTTNASLNGTIEVNDNEWHHIVAIFDGANKTIYFDGSVDSTVASIGTITANDHAVAIGENIQHNTREWEGAIDDVRLYNIGLTASEVQELYSQGQ